MTQQRTLEKKISVSGTGLHFGDQVQLTLRPAPANTGIVFRRVDLNPVVEIPARYDYVADTMLCTSLLHKNTRVATVEHLLSALAGLGIDNLYVDLHGPEIPIMDGSASIFVVLIQSAGIKVQRAPRRYIRILKPVRVGDGSKYAQLLPYNGYRISFTIEFDHPVFSDKPQTASFDFADSYEENVCRARTFGFLKDFEALHAQGLAKGGSLDNAIVVDTFRILNEGGLRFDDEFVKHKILDAIGDLSLLGCRLLGAFEGYKSGHALNNLLLRELMQHQESWEYVTFKEEESEPFIAPMSAPMAIPLEA
ncbi:UDP-3-O-[3-hydroxymyristoyl] N-acetylglucosamine deacetylase [Legionella geestiana]|uniref:UDP-3-O-acyl-N-acetylglucosamine deacetylase n=1 Tax=Legionella geestiana TaxID=45065 RepID=A0A0W0TUC3_9GAMM|nr:UDP-3-O-acyl-N-acetylglucosamine deacetylase [Legionella geestiana]KTC99297.1 UDP-3-O-[3-hydroxymyristoyl] N-acetylglucosamine deacetylase [Legionella geestiana]QBS11989.1 UDP-3-O-acyl-N-acetylglucosamine deacetylase [Legionella geestiana]QDQ40401.1 UDP-3-O-acyl-N-acetylglucosamine deacetylase [Legionella geestiana]STX53297.1 UDP-3-O-[3-hydroxymyristoyl] N-acetylglucosamine deacetylase [Legionella geestiana]